MTDIQPVTGDPQSKRLPVEPQRKEESALRGTFVSVLLVGGFILVSWIGVFLLFINRN